MPGHRVNIVALGIGVVLCAMPGLGEVPSLASAQGPPPTTPRDRPNPTPEIDPVVWNGHRLGKVRFTGASSPWRRALRSVVATRAPRWWSSLLFWREKVRFDLTTAETDRRRITAFYRDRGYYDAEVGPLQVTARDGVVDVVFPIQEGEPTHVVSLALTVEGEKPPEGEDFRPRLPLKVGDVFSADAYGRSKGYLARWYAGQGYAHAKVDGAVRVDAPAATASVELDVRTGASYRYGDTHVQSTGRYPVDPKIIRRHLPWKAGDVYDVRRLAEVQQDLYATGLFTSVEVYPEAEGWTTLDDRSRFNAYGERDFFPMQTHIRTMSARPRQLSLGVGWGSEDRLRGTAGWSHRNLFGDGEQLSFTVRASRLGYEGSSTFLDPALFGTASRARSNLLLGRRVEPPYDLALFHGDIAAERTLRRGITVAAGPVFESARLSGVAESIRERYAPDRHISTVAVQTRLIYDTTDHPLDARKGLRGEAAVERGVDALGGEVGYWQTSVDGRMYLPFGGKWMAAGRGQLARIAVDGGEPIPLHRRYLTGGATSVRGYPRHAIGFRDGGELVGGRFLGLFSLELHYRLNKKVDFVGFGDAGQASEDSAPWSDLVYGAGAGFRYHTVVGPIRVDVAYPLTDLPFTTTWRIHASIGQAF